MITSTKTAPTVTLLDLQHGSLRNKPFDHKTLSLIFLYHQQLQTTSVSLYIYGKATKSFICSNPNVAVVSQIASKH